MRFFREEWVKLNEFEQFGVIMLIVMMPGGLFLWVLGTALIEWLKP